MGENVKPRRAYDNRGRAAQARQTRRRVLAAAHELLLEHGYGATTMSRIAAAAGVSVETVYKSFGTKAALVKEAYDVALVGDDEPIPLAERPEFQALLGDRDPAGKLRRYAALARAVGERISPLASMLLAGAHSGGDRDLEALAEMADRERLAGVTALVGHLDESGGLRPGLDRDRARDAIWTLISPDVYRMLVVERGWSLDDYERWLADTLVATIAG